ncbi:hypothetical protein VPH35_056215 [Triticum aestivum]|uniref:Cytochrome P450 n=2 Tax=Triticum TaxID=4564 RepID=A0A9R1QXQ7_TRITD|nr:unnamed protein product [Triticum aestivum]VAH85603.1 unnamed protein product [Triticum turgidum subsp. durum]
MHRLARRHGPVMLLRLGHVPTLVLSSAEAAREVMKVHDAAFTDRPVYATTHIFTYDGEDISFARHSSRYWKSIRKLCAVELLSPRRVRSFCRVQEEEAVMMNDVVMRASVDDRCTQQGAYLRELDKVLDLMSGFNLIDLFPTSCLARAIGGQALRATWEVHRRIHSIMDAMISDHRTAMEDEEDNDVGREQRGDILTTLLCFQRDNEIGGVALTNENMSDILFDLFAVGSETTATTTIWAMSELMRSPHIMAATQSEVRGVLHGKTEVTEADIDGLLHYLQMVIKETFRDENSWTNASEFMPKRFDDEKVDYGGTDFRFLPGGTGRRMCPGMMFGVSNIEMALVSLLYHFD